MKTNTYLFAAICLPILACGTATPTTSNSTDSKDASALALTKKKTKVLSDTRKETLTSAYQLLDNGVILGVTAAPFASDANFVSIEVSAALQSKSFGQTTTLLVPAGTTSAPTDPNASDEFYVQYGGSTNDQDAGTYGPFVLTSNSYAVSQAFQNTLIADETALDASAFSSDNQITAFRASAQFANIDATPALQSKSFGQSITILVPCGSTGELSDPDLSTTYYVELGAATNKAGGTYGPFSL